MLNNFNTYNQNINFNGYYSCNISKLTSDSQSLLSQGEKVIGDAKKYLQSMQSIDFGKYQLSNCEKPSTISPILRAQLENKDLTMSSYYDDGFSLMVKEGPNIDIISLYGGDSIEFESSRYPLKSSEYKNLSGCVLERAEELLKKYLPIFTKK